MEVEKVKSNFALVMQNLSDLNERVKMFHFYSEKSCDEIMDFIRDHNPFFEDENFPQKEDHNSCLEKQPLLVEEIFEKEELLKKPVVVCLENEIEVQFTLISLTTLQRQRLRRKWLKSTLNNVKEEVKTLLVSAKLILDVKATRFEVIVRNKFSASNDAKTTCFNSKEPFSKVFEGIKVKIDSFPKDEDFFSSDKDKNLITHYVIVKSAGTRERRCSPSKSFSIRMPNYSSKEIIEIVKNKQEGVVKCNQNT